MSEAVNVSSIQLPDASKPYQDTVDLIWNDSMLKNDVSSIGSKLAEFCAQGILSKMFINRMLQSALITKTKNHHLVLQIAKICDNRFTYFYQKITPNPIKWNDDVETYVTKDFNKVDIEETAQYGAVKCFKILVGKFSDFNDDLCRKQKTGGILEIIRILYNHLKFATGENLRTAKKGSFSPR